MATATVTSKDQVTIPAEVRRSLGLKAGSRVDFVRMDDGSYELVPATGTVTAMKGCIPAPVWPVTVEQMEAAIADAVADRTLQ
jgi:AbrB family looped-hinge helix DNA binding protein